MQDRRNPRTEALLAAEVFAAGRMRAVLLVDVSAGGAMIEPPNDLELAAGDIVAVRLYGLPASAAATVRWVRDGQVGIEFRHELHASLLDFLLTDYARSLEAAAAGETDRRADKAA